METGDRVVKAACLKVNRKVDRDTLSLAFQRCEQPKARVDEHHTAKRK